MNSIVRISHTLVLLVVSGLLHAQNQSQEDQTFSEADISETLSCAIRTSGELVCRTNDDRSTFLPPDNLPQLVSVTIGEFHACGLTAIGQAHCWGRNDFGQTSAPTNTLFDVLKAGRIRTCGIDLDGQVQCWGSNGVGESTPQFFEANTINSFFVNTDSNSSVQPNPMVSLELSEFTSCGLDTENIIHCWGLTTSQFHPNRLPGSNSTTVVDFAVTSDNGVFFPDGRTITQAALMQDGSIRSPSGFQSFNDSGQLYSQLHAFGNEICGLRLDGVVVCHQRLTSTTATSNQASLDALNNGEPLQSLVGGLGRSRLCGLTVSQNLRCPATDKVIPPPGVDIEPIAAPQDLIAEVYGQDTIELFWAPNAAQVAAIRANAKLTIYKEDIAGAEIYRDGELLATTTAFSSYFDNTLETGRTYEYRVRYKSHHSDRESFLSSPISVNTGPVANAAPSVPAEDNSPENEPPEVDVMVSDNDGPSINGITVNDQTISWSDEGWFQVLDETDYSEVCGGGTSCTVTAGSYLVINHTTGLRTPGVVVGSSGIAVRGNTISWPDDGWYQVQDEINYEEICGGGSSCDVVPGSYLVINHRTGVRTPGVIVR